jgi:hypothetical protein
MWNTSLVGLFALLAPSMASAQLQGSLTLQSGTSNITAGGDALGTPVTQQGAGSLTTSFSGAIGVNTLDLAGLQISFSNATNFVAGNSGSWQPAPGGGAGSALANYGGVIDLGIAGGVRFSIRNLMGTISTVAPIALTPLGGGAYSFATNQEFTLLSPSALDYAGFGAVGLLSARGRCRSIR